MKNKEIISAVVGGAFFAVPYLALSMPLAPALAIGAAAFGANELLLSPTKIKIKGFSKSIKEVLEDARKQNKEMSNLIMSIEDEDVKKSVRGITKTVDSIITTINTEPKKAEKIDTFFEYYLPVTLKMVKKYETIEEQKLTGKESQKYLTSAKKNLSEANKAFKKIKESLYQSDIVDADADIKVFNTMLKSEGYNTESIDTLETEDTNE